MVTSSWGEEIAGAGNVWGGENYNSKYPLGCVGFLKFSEPLFCLNFKGKRHLLVNPL